MAPVEIGLLLEVSMIVVLLGCRIPFPGAAAKHTDPVVGWSTMRRWVVPQIPITLRVLPRGPRGHEPGMLIRRMIRDIVQEDFELTPMGLGHKLIKVFQGTKEGVDIRVVRDIVAKISHGGRKDRRQPERIDPQPLEVIESTGNAGQITNAITITVHERARIDMIDHAALPPQHCTVHSPSPQWP